MRLQGRCVLAVPRVEKLWDLLKAGSTFRSREGSILARFRCGVDLSVCEYWVSFNFGRGAVSRCQRLWRFESVRIEYSLAMTENPALRTKP